MIVRTIVGLLIVLIVCSCNQQPGKSGQQIENVSKQHLGSKSGLRIENGINRGTGYSDSLGTKYNIRYIPITITNDSIIPIRLQIAFSKEYGYPIAYGDEQYKVILMPKVFTLDGVKLTTEGEMLTDSMQIEFRNYVDKDIDAPYFLNETLDPGEELILAIGTKYLMNKNRYILPNVFFVKGNNTNFQACNSPIDQDGSTESQLALGLKLDINRGEPNESCIIIPCGQIFYLKH